MIDNVCQIARERKCAPRIAVPSDGILSRGFVSMMGLHRGLLSFYGYFNPAPKAQFDAEYNRDNIPWYRLIQGARFSCTMDSNPDGTSWRLAPIACGWPEESIAPLVGNDEDYISALSKRVSAFGSLTTFAITSSVSAGAFVGVGGGEIVKLHDSTNEFLYSLEAADRGCFIKNIYPLRGWKAYVDGARVEVVPVNGMQLGVPIHSGSHSLRLVYMPFSYIDLILIAGGLISLVYLCSIHLNSHKIVKL